MNEIVITALFGPHISIKTRRKIQNKTIRLVGNKEMKKEKKDT
jgi:hypothetical protein